MVQTSTGRASHELILASNGMTYFALRFLLWFTEFTPNWNACMYVPDFIILSCLLLCSCIVCSTQALLSPVSQVTSWTGLVLRSTATWRGPCCDPTTGIPRTFLNVTWETALTIINWKPQDVVVWYYSFDNLEIYVFGNLCLVIYVSQRILEFLIILKFRNDDNNNCNVFVSASAKSTQLMNCTWLVTLRGCTILLQKYELHVYISSVWRECDFFHVVLSVVIDIIVYEA